MNLTRISGTNKKHRVTLYALSTCGWCRRAKDLFNANNIEYDYIDVDLCVGEEREEVINQVQKLNPRVSFPTIQIDDSVVVGFDEERIKQLLEIK
ncbi:MAG: glutaredoxin family protein [candidate division WOR-3 bacterium]|jgi:glutaredoxin|nr:glutaredoxin family protein [candidate division WOR-3 bacterium]MCR4423848.1 glutaredoxin family protein [candidate division WOR-3 bacterium]MDH7519187.1 glutaredoxin family protein [bacterium]